jgi:hypothetical protein
MKRTMLSAAILGLLGFGASFSALAAPYPVNLCAGEFEKELADGTTVTMWGYSRGVSVASGNGIVESNGCAGPFTSPGPLIDIPDNQGRLSWDGLSIKLTNTLSRSTSLVIPGTVKGMSPQLFTPPNDPDTPADESLIQRVRAFDVEALPDGSQTYIWENLQPGSYMYHSGTHPQVQVQMGLYGAVVDDVKQGAEAYPGVNYTHDVVLFYTEIDRVIHDSVKAGDHNETDMKSTIGYAPKHFAVDVVPGSGITVDADGNIEVPNGVNPLIRFFNAGHRSHVPTVYSGGFDIQAEDGKQYSNSRQQYSIHLAPLKTKDAILDLSAGSGGGSFRLTDSAMALSSPETVAVGAAVPLAGTEIANGDGNGMAVTISVTAATGGSGDSDGSGNSGGGGISGSTPSADAPVARRDRMTVTEGNAIDNVLAAALGNDTNATLAGASILAYPTQGELISEGDSYRYEHGGGEETRDSFIYQISNAAGESSQAGVVIDVMGLNDAPDAQDDTIATTVGKLIEIRALRNDTDVDSEIHISGVDSSGLGSLTALEQVIVFEATTAGSEDVAYTIADTSGASASAVLHLSVTEAGETAAVFGSGNAATSASSGGRESPGVAPNATDDGYNVVMGETVDNIGTPILGVLANDSTGAVVNTRLIEYPASGSILINEDGTFVYTHDGSGTANDDFVYEIYNDNGTAQARVTFVVNEE